MGLIDRTEKKRVEVPDGWVDVRASLSIGEVLGLFEGLGLSELTNPSPKTIQRMLAAAVVAWSYGEPVTEENIERLDLGTAAQLLETLRDLLWGDNQESEEERKNGFAPSISDLTGRKAKASQKNG